MLRFWEAKFPTRTTEGITGMPKPEAEKLPRAKKPPTESMRQAASNPPQHPVLPGGAGGRDERLKPLLQGPTKLRLPP